MRGRTVAFFAALVVAAGAVASVAIAAGPPPPKTFGGAKVKLFATGLDNPTSFAWGDGAMFAGDSGNSSTLPNGGVYVIKNSKATKISPLNVLFVGGMAWHGGALYLSDAALVGMAPAFQISKWSGWNGTTFTSQKVLYTAPKGFDGFNGVAFGPDGRLYVGVDLGLTNNNDHNPAGSTPYLYDILSMNTSGKGLKVFATGIRQPWQMAFAPGSKEPFVSDLGQDSDVKNPADSVLKVKQGDNYGFPKCNQSKATAKVCKKYAKPFKQFAPHTDIMGLAIVGKTLYMGSFLGAGAKGGGALYSMPLAGGTVKTVVEGFPASTDSLALHDGNLYVGGSTQKGAGLIWQVTP